MQCTFVSPPSLPFSLKERFVNWTLENDYIIGHSCGWSSSNHQIHKTKETRRFSFMVLFLFSAQSKCFFFWNCVYSKRFIFRFSKSEKKTGNERLKMKSQKQEQRFLFVMFHSKPTKKNCVNFSGFVFSFFHPFIRSFPLSSSFVLFNLRFFSLMISCLIVAHLEK
jgi:hypothetical protein